MPHRAFIECTCGHSVSLSLEDLPPEYLDPYGWTIRPEVLARFRCEACGLVGRPDVRFYWSHVG